MPKISVLISAYNHECFVGAAIESVLAQDFEDWELIIRDDASPDRTAEVAGQYRDPRIKHLPAAANLGGAEGLNECFRASTGEYIAVLNSDDMMLPDRLSRSAAVLDARPELGAVFGHAQVVDVHGVPLPEDGHPYCRLFNQPNRTRHEWLRHFFYWGNGLCHPSVMMRRAAFEGVGGYDPFLVQLADFDLWVRLCSQYEIHVLQTPTVKFRILPGEGNASGDCPARRERLTYENVKVMDLYARPPLLEQLHHILPDWIPVAGDRRQRLRRFASALLAVSTSAHHSVAVEVLRRSQAESGSPGSEVESMGDLHALLRSARPCSMAIYPPPLYYVFAAREGVPVPATPSLHRPLWPGEMNAERADLPLETAQVRLMFGGGIQAAHLHGVTLLNSAGEVVWDLESALQAGESLPVELEAASAGHGQSGSGTPVEPLLSLLPGGGITLPSVAAGNAAQLRLKVFVEGVGNLDAPERALALQKEVQRLRKEEVRTSKRLARLEKELLRAGRQLTSACEWSQRPWYRRIFSRWKGSTLNQTKGAGQT